MSARTPVETLALQELIRSRVVVTEEGCWEYQGHRSARGYCDIKWMGRSWRVHRVSYIAFHGPFDQSLLVCHSCDNPPCCNPAHLFLGDHKVNALDAARKGRLNTPGPRGENHPQVTVPNSLAREAVRRYLCGETQRSIAEDLGVTQGSVSNWVLGKVRRDIGLAS